MIKSKVAVLVIFCLLLTSIFSVSMTTTVLAGTQATYYVSPTGNDTTGNGTLSSPWQTIQRARDAVRTVNSNMTGDIIIYQRGGTYTLTDTLQFTQLDSGTNGYNVIYKNYTGETPVISGGQTITGWTLHDATKNIYKANVDALLETRQLYVNGVRAIRARSTGGLPGAVKTSTGYTTTDTNMQNWGNKSDIEFVYNILWAQCRVGVSSIVGTTVNMDLTCFTAMGNNWTTLFTVPTYIENAYELLDAEGEWYLDRTAHILYYKPRNGESMSTATIVAAKLETLVNGTGTLDTPIHNIRFEGITFAYATWLGPNTPDGYAEVQANYCLMMDTNKEHNWRCDDWVRTPANIKFITAKNIVFERNKFLHLGAVGLSFETGSQSNTISGNEFTDISGSGIALGGVTWNDHHPTDLRNVVKDNNITNNYIHNVAVEYRGNVGIFAGYTDNTKIANNEICDLPYTGISIGWGWGARDLVEYPFVALAAEEPLNQVENNTPSTSKNNKILNNHIHHVMNYLIDGGGIYTLGAQPGTIIQGNVVHDMQNYYGSIYLDNGSRYMSVKNNITYSNYQNYITNGGFDHDIEFNYWEVDNSPWGHYSGLQTNNYIIGNGNVPPYILDNTGLQAAYIDLLPRKSVNLSIGKTATAYWNDGSLATMHVGYEAYKAVDGNKSTKAQANGQYAWTLEVDLGAVYSVDRVLTNFATDTYATDYEIQISTIGGNGNFTTIKTVTGCTGGVSEQTFTPVNARYVRIKAIKPDGPGQTGNQMSIIELEVYGIPTFTPSSLPDLTPVVIPDFNVALIKTSSAYWIDGSPATMHTGYEADKANDGDINTFAQADGQYAWQYQVDMGYVYNINRIKTTFCDTAYATDYEIRVSTDGSSFTTVKTITGCTGGASEQTFSPVNARYVRIKAIKPDGPNQPGNQMAIKELEVYEYRNYAYKKTATGYWNDGTLATMWTGSEADKAVDGKASTTGAQANGQYAWTLEVDMGAVYSIHACDIYFGLDSFATDYEIQLSAIGGNGNFTTVKTVNGYTGGLMVEQYFPSQPARYVRIKALKPDGPNQPGNQMRINEIRIRGLDYALELSEMTNSTTGVNKYFYQAISNSSFTFQPGDVISYDVKLLTNSVDIGGIDIKNTDGSRFRDAIWSDQNGITGNPTVDLRSRAYKKWYHRELTVPTSMGGKTASQWMLAFENDSVSTVLQASYDNIIVKRAGNAVLTVYGLGNTNPTANGTESSSYYSTTAGAGIVSHY